MTLTESIGVIGTGKMGTALIRGLLKKKLVKPEQIFAYDILEDIPIELAKDFNINVALSNLQIAE
jgi:pyrroline-5-carboxylate reductase